MSEEYTVHKWTKDYKVTNGTYLEGNLAPNNAVLEDGGSYNYDIGVIRKKRFA